MIEVSIILISSVLAFILVEAVRRWGLRQKVLDVPNERSSHSTPVPRAGGLGIVATVFVVYVSGSYAANYPLSLGFLIGSLIVAAVSFIDDLRDLPFYVRLFAQAIAAALVVADIGVFGEISYLFIDGSFSLGVFAIPLTITWILWMINAYNFMDGIDGIAGLQAVVAAIGWALFSLLFGVDEVKWLALGVGGASIGFLVHNWSPARIFMGDVGSAFLGFLFAVLPLIASKGQSVPTGVIPILGVLFVFPFIFDTVFTFLRRLFNREKVWKAHRSHLYQRMVINGASHSYVTLIYGALAAVSSLVGISVVAQIEIAGPLILFCILSASAFLLLMGSKKR
ncbi:MAG: glycosyltransferase family 4 protein [Acidobacteria bacterium]|nr:glycosyltransferase family 4 protein [Acidobacteriota bacterium]